MSVVIVGGNECMVREYKELCKNYRCQAKVYPKMEGTLKNKIGSPDLLVLFTGTMSHKMLRCVISETKRSTGTVVARSHSSSMSALRGILEEHAPRTALSCQ